MIKKDVIHQEKYKYYFLLYTHIIYIHKNFDNKPKKAIILIEQT